MFTYLGHREYEIQPLKRVINVSRYGGWKAMSFCTLSAACGGARDPNMADPSAAFRPRSDDTASLYCWGALAAHARCGTHQQPHSLSALLAAYSALAGYGPMLPRPLR